MRRFGVEIEFLLSYYPFFEKRGDTEDLFKKTYSDIKNKIISPVSWDCGLDGIDSETKKPILEFRIGILESQDGLKELLDNVKSYAINDGLWWPGHVGIHYHIETDQNPFSLLALTVGIDEQRTYIPNRDCRHCKSIKEFYSRIRTDKDFLTFDELKLMFGTDREWGVCIASRHPTVEYRYLPTELLMQDNGVLKVIDFLNYFIEHTEKMSVVNRFRINDVVFEKTKNGVRIS